MLDTMLSDLEDMADSASWMDGAVCAQTDPEAFFPPEQAGPAWYGDAVRMCQRCQVRDACLAYAVDNGIAFGVWGGLTEQERRPLLRVETAA